MDKTISSLTKIEIEVLKSIKKESDSNKIQEITGMENIEVMRALSWLESKSLIKTKPEVKEIAELTKTGKIYLKTGLPEDRTLSALYQKGEMTPEEIMKIALLDNTEFRAAIGLLRKKGIIGFSNGKIKLLEKKAIKNPLMELLKKAPFEIKKKNENLIELKKRGILSFEIKTTKKVFLTKKGEKIKSQLKKMEVIDRITPSIIRKKKWVGKIIRRYNVEAEVPKMYIGKKHPYLSFIDEIKYKLVGMGFKEMDGPIIESNFWNCDALFMPQNHPARGIHDIYFVKEPKYGDIDEKMMKRVKKEHEIGWGYRYSEMEAKRLILRSQGTAISARMLANPELEIPGKYFSIARVFRPDTIDWKHLTEFNQMEGIILGKGLNIKSLLGILKVFAKQILGAKKYRFKPDYYPFTEPSIELSVYMEGRGWVELGGSGIFRPEVTEPFGIDVPVIAWGLGIDRFYMIKNNVDDIRKIFSTDLGWIRRNA